MSWEPSAAASQGMRRPLPCVVDPETGPVSIAWDTGEPWEIHWSRMCVMSQAPELHHALSDLLVHARKNFPEVMEPALKEAEKVLNRVKELYEQGRT